MDVRLDRLTAPEAGERLREADACVLPCGSLEQHGEHLPVGTDAFIAEALAARLIERARPGLDLLLLPPLAYGRSPEHTGFPGTVSLSRVALIETVTSIVEALAAHGARHLLVLNAHGGNSNAIAAILRDVRDRTAVLPLLFDVYRSTAVTSTATPGDWHAGRTETSLYMALVGPPPAPATAPDSEAPPPWSALTSLHYPWRAAELSAGGAVGDSAGADAAVGEQLADALIDEALGALRTILAWKRGTR